MTTRDTQEIKKAVEQRYAQIAREHADPAAAADRPACCSPQAASTSCCPSPTRALEGTYAGKLYSAEELQGLPESVSGVSLGCGNPVALAELREGEVVLDLGSGGGIDCFLAAQRVGPGGRVIGLDMTRDMIELARANAAKMGVPNVEFRLGEMEHMPVDSGSVDAIISNCVINLSPDKDAVFAEAYRVLRPGGKLSVSDIVVRGELPPEARESLAAWACCVGGALKRDNYLAKVRAAGFVDIEVTEETVPFSTDLPDWVHYIASAKVKARKPGR